MEKKRFIFDLDETLLTRSFQIEPDYFKSLFGNKATILIENFKIFLDEYESLFEKYDRITLSEFLTTKSGLIFTPEMVDGWVNELISIPDTLEDGVLEVLEYLKGKNKSLVVLTNWFGKTQIPRLQSAGIYEYFDDVITGDINLKPYPDAYERARGTYDPEYCVVIGDTIDKDYLEPKKNGIDAILYDKEEKYKSDYIKVKNMKELIEWY